MTTTTFKSAHILTRCLVNIDGGDYRATFALCVRFLCAGGDLNRAMADARRRHSMKARSDKYAAQIAAARASVTSKLTGPTQAAALAIIDDMAPTWDGFSMGALRKSLRTIAR